MPAVIAAQAASAAVDLSKITTPFPSLSITFAQQTSPAWQVGSINISFSGLPQTFSIWCFWNGYYLCNGAGIIVGNYFFRVFGAAGKTVNAERIAR